MYNLSSEFDIQLHKQHYVNYLEVIIFPSGKVVYAVPSHQEMLINIACTKYKCSRDELMQKCPEDMIFDFMTWLINITKCIAVWTGQYLGNPNRFQKHKLQQLYKEGLLNCSISI